MVSVTEVDSSQGYIKSVTIYRTRKAEVVRAYKLNLQEGDNEIRISGLSSQIDAQSVRVSGLGTRNRLVDVSCTTKANPSRFKPSKELQPLLLKRQNLEAEKLIRQQATDVYLSYAKSLTSERVSTEQLVPFMHTLVQERQSIADAISSLDEQIRVVTDAIGEHNAQNSKQQGVVTGHVTLRVYVDTASHYGGQVPGAQPGESEEPDEQWKKRVRDDIDAEFSPDISRLLDDKVKQLASSASQEDQQRIEEQYEEHMSRYVALASQRYEERLDAERARRQGLHQQDEGRAVSFILSYNVSDASWKPLYDVHATSQEAEAKTPVTLSYRASITQSTGETWNNAPLVLSTASDATHSNQIPRLPTYRLRPPAPLFRGGLFGNAPQPQTSPFGASASAGGLFGFGGRADIDSSTDQIGQVPPAPPAGLFGTVTAAHNTSARPQAQPSPDKPLEGVDETKDLQETKLQTTPVFVSYAVGHPVNIPSDGAAHTVTISTLQLEAQVSRICVPRVEAVAYLQCKILNKSDYQLVAGPVNVYLEDNFVARTSIKDTEPNESFECTLGADRALRVTYERISNKEPNNNQSAMFGERKYITKYTVRTYITNKHPFPISNLIVHDALPLAPYDNVKVVLRKPEGLAEAKPGEKIRVADNVNVGWSRKSRGSLSSAEGKYTWLVGLEGNKGCTLETQWEIQSSSDSLWEEVADSN